ncbi:acylphosphatase [Virgibacillus natechei]
MKGSIPDDLIADKISMYTIGLEGWRRGLTLKFYKELYEGKMLINYSLSNNKKEYRFAVSKGELVTDEARDISRNKGLTKEYLSNAGVPVPLGKDFNEEVSDIEIIEYAKTLGFPVVLKPINGKLGKGVIPNILNIEDFSRSLSYVRGKLGYFEVIVEQYIPGDEYRLYVIDGKVIGAIKRVPANIIGDGHSSIKELINRKNKNRQDNPNLRSRPIKVDSEVKKYIQQVGYNLNSIISQNEQIYLRKNSNISSGGEPIDVTDKMSNKIKNIAIKTADAIPGMIQCGVDVIINNISAVVLEVNTKPGIGSHVFPIEGDARDIPKAIIDYYFPETFSRREIVKKKDIYYDYRKITDILKQGIVSEVKLPDAPDNLSLKAFNITGKVQGVGYRRWIQKQSVNLELNGFVKNLANGAVLVVTAGEEKNVNVFKDIINSKSPSRAKVNKVMEERWNEPIKLGFEIRNENNEIQELKKKNRIIKQQKQKINDLEEDKIFLEKQYRAITQSKIWKYTSIFRKKFNF